MSFSCLFFFNFQYLLDNGENPDFVSFDSSSKSPNKSKKIVISLKKDICNNEKSTEIKTTSQETIAPEINDEISSSEPMKSDSKMNLKDEVVCDDLRETEPKETDKINSSNEEKNIEDSPAEDTDAKQLETDIKISVNENVEKNENFDNFNSKIDCPEDSQLSEDDFFDINQTVGCCYSDNDDDLIKNDETNFGNLDLLTSEVNEKLDEFKKVEEDDNKKEEEKDYKKEIIDENESKPLDNDKNSTTENIKPQKLASDDILVVDSTSKFEQSENFETLGKDQEELIEMEYYVEEETLDQNEELDYEPELEEILELDATYEENILGVILDDKDTLAMEFGTSEEKASREADKKGK